MSDHTLKIIERKIDSLSHAFMFGAAEALGKGVVYALILILAIGWVSGDDDPAPIPQPPATGETE